MWDDGWTRTRGAVFRGRLKQATQSGVDGGWRARDNLRGRDDDVPAARGCTSDLAGQAGEGRPEMLGRTRERWRRRQWMAELQS